MRERERSTSCGKGPEWVGCVWLPHFAVWAERARRPELPAGPLVLVGAPEGGGAPVARACSPEAQASGLFAGMPAHTLPQRCPGAVVLPFDAPHYQQRYEQLLQALDTITPLIEAQPLEAFYLDLTGLPHLDVEDPAQVQRAVRAAIPAPFLPRLGLASGKFTAWVAANRATSLRPLAVPDPEKRHFLRQAPSTLLPARPEVARQLDQMGLRTLERIARLPRSAMLSRFGWPGERLHRLACGEDREPLRPYRPEPVVRESWCFGAAPTTAHFYLALRQLLLRAWSRPERGGQGVRGVRLQALFETGEGWERRLTLRQPTEQPEHAFLELHRRLETVLPTGAVAELHVELTAFAPRLDRQRLLFPDERQQRRDRLRHEIEQLRERGRLRGRPGVYQVVEVDPWSLLPEEQYGLVRYDP